MRFAFLVFLLAIAVWASQPFSHPQEANAADTVRVFVEFTGGYRESDWHDARSIGANPRYAFAAANTISVDIPEYLLPLLERNPRVKVIRPVPLVAAIEDSLPWGIDQVDAERVWGGAEDAVNVASGANSGAGVRVAVVDTGIAAHSELNIVGGASFVSGVSSYNDGNGHGTHVAGTIAARDNGSGVLGIAPGASLLAVKVLADSGSGYLDDVAAGIDWATSNGAKVVNMSLSCSGSTACDDPVMNTAMQNAANAGVVIVAAAGNTGAGTDTVGWPAKSPYAIAVAATTSTNARASFSSTGPAVEIAAPGNAIYSTYPGGGYATMSGTSMASPHVAGAAALLSACGMSASQIRTTLTSTADDLGAAGRDNEFGYGLLDVDGAMAACGGGAVEPTPPSGGSSTTITDDFESGGWSGGSGWSAGSWSRTGSTSYTTVTTSSSPQAGSRHVQIRYNAGITRTFSLSGVTNPTLTFYSKGSSWESSDRVTVQVSTNGSSWTTLATYQNTSGYTSYTQRQLSLSQWAGQGTVYLRFLGQMSSSSDYWYVDSITVAGSSGGSSSNPTPTNTPVPPTNTPVPPTNTPVTPPTNTPVPPTSTPTPPPSGGSITETFESGNWSGGTGWTSTWSRTGSTSYTTITTSSSPQSGSRHVQIRANAGLTRTFSLSGFGSATLSFYSKGSSWESSDRVSVQVSTNGSSWTTIATYQNSSGYTSYTQRSLNLSQWAGQGTVFLRFLGQMSSSSDYWYVDSISVTSGSGGGGNTGPEDPEPTATFTPPPAAPTATPTPGNGGNCFTWGGRTYCF